MGGHSAIHREFAVPRGPHGVQAIPAFDSEGAFEGVLADTPELREECFRIRYQVYCVERQFEERELNPGGLERDIYDEHSVHALVRHRASRVAIGAIRLILPKPGAQCGTLPFHSICRDSAAHDQDFLPPAATAEVSRLSISKARCRTIGQMCEAPVGRAESLLGRVPAHATAVVGLLRLSVEMALANGVRYFCAVMEPTLLKMLRRYGIYFDVIGPLVSYHGLRQPCCRNLGAILDTLEMFRPDVWAIITDQGRFRAIYGQRENYGSADPASPLIGRKASASLLRPGI